MRIDGTYGPGVHGPDCRTQGLPAAAAARSRAGARAPDAGATPDLSPSESEYVRKAMAAEDVNAAAVAEARRLLQAGELDTPEAAQRAAQAILQSGA